MTYVDQKPADEITVDFYSGSEGKMFMLYEDDGTTNAYKNGAYSLIPISFMGNDQSCVLMFGQRQGEFDGMIRTRRINIRYHMPDRTIETAFDYDGKRYDYHMVLK